MICRLLVFFLLFPPLIPVYAARAWKGELPPVAKDAGKWLELTEALKAEGLSYGTFAVAMRSLVYFNEVSVKEHAFKTLIDLSDLGYAMPLKTVFAPADLEPLASEPFASSYYFYKGLVAHEMQMKKWAKRNFEKLDAKTSAKYIFWQAVNAYRAKDLILAEQLLQQVLSLPLQRKEVVFAKKVVRTLARLYFEKKEYEKSYSFYHTFLLNVNPVSTADWLEAAWNLYYLKQPEKALGFLYNLESRFLDGPSRLEKYVLRAMIYRDACATESMDGLLKSFDEEYGSIVRGIKTGELLSSLSPLAQIFVSENRTFHELKDQLEELKYESTRIGRLPTSLRQEAERVYSSEAELTKRLLGFQVDRAQRSASKALVDLSEKLKFLKFDVAREKFNPDLVFTASQELPKLLNSKEDHGGSLIHWPQPGDFWRDERLHYIGRIVSSCGK